VLVVHVAWSEAGALFWAEDGSRPAPGPRRGRAGTRPRRHPFAAPPDVLATALRQAGPALLARAADRAQADTAALWLPVRAGVPDPSPQLLREAGDDGGGPEPRLAPVLVPALRLEAGAALDALLLLAGGGLTGMAAGASVTALAGLAGLALEVVAAGRVLPDLEQEGRQALARWRPVPTGEDEERLALLAGALPAAARALIASGPRADRPSAGPARGQDPAGLVRAAFSALVDAACREGLGRRRARRPAPGTGVLGTWVEALGAPDPVVRGAPQELAALASRIHQWRGGVPGGAGGWRLCFRLTEPAEPDTDRTAGAATDVWSLDLLLQATDDPSLQATAAEVWRSGRRLRRASRTLEDPQERLLAELGRAARVYDDLGPALRQAAPTSLVLDDAGAHRFLAAAAPALQAAGFGIQLPSWWRRGPARLGLRLRSSTPSRGSGSGLLSGDDLTRFDWEAALGDEALTPAELRRLAALKAPLVRVRGRWVEVDQDEIGRLVAFVGRGRRTVGPVDLPELVRLAAGGSGPDGLPVVGVAADGPVGALLRGELVDHLVVRRTPAGFRGTLRPYQARGVAWLELLGRLGLGACLADDMGLGKTATVLALLQAERRRRAPARRPGPTLVVCPTSVVGNWQREAERFTPALRVHVHHGQARSRAAALAEAADCDLVITSYGLVARDRAALAAVPWARLVLDEAQNVKNAEAKQTKAVRTLAAPQRIALTGTPVENHLGELWSIMEILNPGLLGSATRFRERYALPIERYRDEEAAEALTRLTRPFLLRRLKTDKTVISDLPDKFEMKVVCSLTREQATLYQAVVDEMLERIEHSEGIERRGLVLAAMLRLKQVCNHPAHYLSDGSALAGRSGKLERTVELLEEVLDGGERALVFTQFAEMGTLLQAHLQERLGRRVAFLHGGVPRRRRDAMVAAFQDSDGEEPVLVLSLKAGGTGLNLTAANHVVHFDRWWNPAVEDQATDRAFRIGQRRDVQVRKLVCAGTLEDRIDAMIEAKADLARRIVGSGEAWLTELSTAELADVLRLSAETMAA
jgi:non-specific serine/threonine protein kinase